MELPSMEEVRAATEGIHRRPGRVGPVSESDALVDVVVDFPLRGEWRAVNTPAHKVPSHGTDFFAQRYAFDFSRMGSSGAWFYAGGAAALLRHVTLGLPAERFYSWDQPVYAAFPGRVVAARDGWPDRTRVLLPWELMRSTLAPSGPFQDGDYRPLAGNFVMVEGEEGVAFYAHLRQGSIVVRENQRLSVGEVIGGVGNSGNSTMPHLHFHVMDGPDPLAARALACAFRHYERWNDGRWQGVGDGVPDHLERIRSA
jgi:hypothetical protein